jgi:hypothetical protein
VPVVKETLEARRIDPVGLDLENVPGRTRDDCVVRERRAQAGDVDAQCLLGAGRRIPVPELFHQLVDRDRSPRLEQEKSEERALPPAAEPQWPAVARGFDRAEHPELDRRPIRVRHGACIHSPKTSRPQVWPPIITSSDWLDLWLGSAVTARKNASFGCNPKTNKTVAPPASWGAGPLPGETEVAATALFLSGREYDLRPLWPVILLRGLPARPGSLR